MTITRLGLSEREKQVYDYIESKIATSGISPAYREIAQATNIGLGQVHNTVRHLCDKGYLIKSHQSKSIMITVWPKPVKKTDTERLAKLEKAIQDILNVAHDAPELNMLNYDEDEVNHLNVAMIEIYEIAIQCKPA